MARHDQRGLPLVVLEQAPATSACVRFIDPYGDTLFNQFQLPILVEELEAILLHVHHEETRKALRAAITFVEESRGLGVFVRCIGD